LSCRLLVFPSSAGPERPAVEQTGHVIGDQEYRAMVPFPVTIVPAKLVTAG
jgi:hypothetical protein